MIELQTTVFYTQFNVYTSSSYQKYKKLLYVRTACCLLNEGAFFFVLGVCTVGVEYFNVSFFFRSLFVLFFSSCFLLLLLFTVLWIYCEYIFNTISLTGSDTNLATKKLLCRIFLYNRALPFFSYKYSHFNFQQ